jgi:pyruvate,water dikinase
VRKQQKQLRALLSLGKPTGPWRRSDQVLAVFAGDMPTPKAAVSGIGTSAGAATGRVRIVRGIDDFDAVEQGDVLVAPITAPAWTPLSALAAAVVTDGGRPLPMHR